MYSLTALIISAFATGLLVFIATFFFSGRSKDPQGEAIKAPSRDRSSEIADQKKRLDDERGQSLTLQRRVDELEQKLRAAEKVKAPDERLAELDDIAQKRKTRINKLKRELKLANKNADQVSRQRDQLQKKLDAAPRGDVAAQRALLKATEKADVLRVEKASLETEVRALKKQLAEDGGGHAPAPALVVPAQPLSPEQAEDIADSEEAARQLSTLKGHIDTITAERDQLRRKLDDTTARLESLKQGNSSSRRTAQLADTRAAAEIKDLKRKYVRYRRQAQNNHRAFLITRGQLLITEQKLRVATEDFEPPEHFDSSVKGIAEALEMYDVKRARFGRLKEEAARVADLEVRLAALDSGQEDPDIERGRRALEEANARVESISAQMQEARARAAAVEKDLSSARARVDTLQAERDAAAATIPEATARELEEARARIQTLETDLAANQSGDTAAQLDEARARLATLEADVQRVAAEVPEDAARELEEARARAATLEQQLGEATAAIPPETAAALEAATARAQQLEDELRAAQRAVPEDIQRDLDAARERTRDLEAQLADVADAVPDSVQARLDALEQKLADRSGALDDARAQLADLEARLSQAQDAVPEAATRELEAARARVADLETQLESAPAPDASSTSSDDARLGDLEAQVAKFEKRYLRIKDSRKVLRRELGQAQDRVVELEETLRAAQAGDSVDALNRKLEAARERITALETQSSEAPAAAGDDARVADLEAEAAKYEKRYLRIKDSRKVLRRELGQAEDRIAELERELGDAQRGAKPSSEPQEDDSLEAARAQITRLEAQLATSSSSDPQAGDGKLRETGALIKELEDLLKKEQTADLAPLPSSEEVSQEHSEMEAAIAAALGIADDEDDDGWGDVLD